MNSRGSSTTIRTKTYDLIFHKNDNQEHEFNDFTDYKIARQVFKIVSKSNKMSSRNIIEEMLKKASQREKNKLK